MPLHVFLRYVAEVKAWLGALGEDGPFLGLIVVTLADRTQHWFVSESVSPTKSGARQIVGNFAMSQLDLLPLARAAADRAAADRAEAAAAE
jgi:hypothetical protein